MWKWEYVIVGATACLCYLNTLFGTFVFDDTEAIVKNKDVLPSTPFHQMFRNDFWGTDISLNSSHKSYRPLTVLTFRLNLLLNNSKLHALQFHAVNILLYVSLCLVLIPTFKILVGARRKSKTAFLSALLFAVHPVHTEVVAGLVGRADILSALLTLWSLILYVKLIRQKSVILFLAINLLIMAAVLCKETAIAAYVLCSTYDVFSMKILIRNDGVLLRSWISSHRNFIYRNLGLLGFGVAILYFRFWIMNFEKPIFAPVDNPAAFSENYLTRVLTYNYIYFLNLLLLIWPQWLCFDWSMGCIPLIESIHDPRVIFVLCLWFLITLSGYKLFTTYQEGKTSPAALLACALTILPFIPASNVFVVVGFVIAERTLLLPSAGFCLLVVLGLNKLSKKTKEKKVYVGFYILCIVFAFHTIQRNLDWTTEEQLFRSALSVCPLNAKVHYNIAKVAADQSDKNLALSEYRKAIELNPTYEQAMNNLANLLREDRLFEEAEVLLRKALQIRPNFAAAWMNLGIVLTNLNQSGEAEECYLKAISFRPKYPDCYYNLGNLYLDLRRNEDALKSWEKAVAYRPSHTAAWSNTLVLLDSLYRYNEVLELGKVALMHNPKSPALHFSLANTLGKLKQFEKAEKHFLEALNFNPDNALYYSNLDCQRLILILHCVEAQKENEFSA